MQKSLLSTVVPVVPVAFAAAIALPAVIGIATTDLPNPDLSVINGAYQRAYEDRFSDGFPLSRLSQEAYTTFNLALFGQAGPDVVIGAQDWLFTAEEFQPPAASVDLLTELQVAADALAAQDITLVPVIIPDKARIYKDKLPRQRGPALAARYANALDALHTKGFVPIDLVGVLHAGRLQHPTFMRTDTHWSPFGARLAADHVAEALGLKGAGSDAFVTEETPDQAFEGDLMTFVDAGRFADWVGITPESIDLHVTRAADSGGLGLFGEAKVKIVLVGTSFSAKPEFNFDGALKAATQMDAVNLSVEGQGPFVPMTVALESGAIADIAPQYVIWEIPERYIQPWRSK